MLLILSACSASPSETATVNIEGIWTLEAFEIEGVRQEVELGVNAAEQPWLQVADVLVGNGGCNGFGDSEHPHRWDGELLIPGEVVAEASLCVSEAPGTDVMATENAFIGMLWNEERIQVKVRDQEMEWTAGDTRLVFSSATEPPFPVTTPEIEPSVGRLDCSSGVVVETRVANTGQNPIDVVHAASPAVFEVEPAAPLWHWGLNRYGAVVVAIAQGDTTRGDYQVWTCDPPLDDPAP